MNENPIVTAAKEAYAKIDNEQDRLTFIDWCRRENDKALFRTIDFAEHEAVEEARSSIASGLESIHTLGDNLRTKAGDAIDAVKKGTSKLDDLMSDILGGSKKDQ